MDFVLYAFDTADMLVEAILIACAAPRLLSMRRPLLFGCIEVLGTFFCESLFVWSGQLVALLWGGFVAMVFLQFVLPCLFWRGSWLRRIVAAFLLVACLFLANDVADIAWQACFGLAIPEESVELLQIYAENPPLWFGYEFMYLVVGIGSLALVSRALRKWRPADHEEHFAFAIVLLAEVLLSICLAMVAARSAADQWSIALIVAELLLLVTGGVVAVASVRLLAAREARLRTSELMLERDAFLEGYCASREEIRDFALLRHDFRNELTAVEALVERGRIQEARAVLADLGERCASGEPENMEGFVNG